jgi:hypothetical protein
LTQISTNLSQGGHNLPLSSNIERTMVANLATSLDTYFHFGQISLEGHLKFLGQWNKNQAGGSGLAASFSNFVAYDQGTSKLTVVDEVCSV